MSSEHSPFLLIVSAPSGCGKTTLLKELFSRVDGLGMSISHTTRKPRGDEICGVDYHFIDHADFNDNISQGFFVEHATVHGNFYGTSFDSIRTQLESGLDVVLDIDVQGMAKVISASTFDVVSVFILPPDLSVLEGRLRNRKTDSEIEIQQRLANAVSEMGQAYRYDYLLENNNFDVTLDKLAGLVSSERLRTARSKLLTRFLL